MAREKIYNNEKDVKKEVKRLLDAHGWFWWMPPANGFGKVGISDINALRHGVFLAVETKFGYNKPTPQQKGFLHSINSHDAFGFVVTEKTVGSLQVWLEAFDRARDCTATGTKMADEDGAAMLNAIAVMTELLVTK
ncbi:hypothetical protein [Silvimonas sp.]|uniref:hypothetical protein n=1 Tax=Silvimonas sp. TaxID=2650811 RepID=UPI00284176F2|nr:hypothetical protein [Silvimonas sp.]MDR3427792.1 hypothetical protein [Silvimonas sp.]